MFCNGCTEHKAVMDTELLNLLAELRDIQSPQAISWWPPASGWWFLAILITGVIIALGWMQLRRFRRGAFRRQGLKELLAAYQIWQDDRSDRTFLQNCNQLLRRLGIYQQGREQIASLHGESWRRYLIEAFGTSLSRQSIDELVEQSYRPTPQADPERICREIEQLLQQPGEVTHV